MPRRRRTVKRRRSVRRKAPMRPMVREEMKTNDITSDTTLNCSTDGTVAATQAVLNLIDTGTSSTTRVGKKIVMKALQIRGKLAASTATLQSKVAILLIYVRSNNKDAAPTTWTNILTSQHSNALTNRDNASRYKILRRWDYSVIGNIATAGQSTEKSMVSFDEYVVFKKPLVASWQASAGAGTAIGDFEKGSLHLCAVGDFSDAGTSRPTLVFRSRLYFCECDGYMF